MRIRGGARCDRDPGGWPVASDHGDPSGIGWAVGVDPARRWTAPTSQDFGDPEEAVAPSLPSDYIGLVDDAIAAIRSGSLSKVVLARSVLVRRSVPIDAFALVGALRDAYPTSWVFGWQEGDGVFIGASPELVVARRGDHVHPSPLAGSASRSADPEQDRRHGEALLASRKDRFEHEVVIADVLERLALSSRDSTARRLHNSAAFRPCSTSPPRSRARHRRGSSNWLRSSIHRRCRRTPRAEAVRFIEKTEGIDRGWYAGGIGWADGSGDGEIAIDCAVPRCGVIPPSRTPGVGSSPTACLLTNSTRPVSSSDPCSTCCLRSGRDSTTALRIRRCRLAFSVRSVRTSMKRGPAGGVETSRSGGTHR